MSNFHFPFLRKYVPQHNKPEAVAGDIADGATDDAIHSRNRITLRGCNEKLGDVKTDDVSHMPGSFPEHDF
jgi:hypothetical protein